MTARHRKYIFMAVLTLAQIAYAPVAHPERTITSEKHKPPTIKAAPSSILAQGYKAYEVTAQQGQVSQLSK